MDKLKNILTKKPWPMYQPGFAGTPLTGDEVMTQRDFLRQYFPSSHQIFDRSAYPDIYREVDEPVYDAEGQDTGRTTRVTYVEKVPRYAFAFQQIITLKQVIHATGNDVQLDLDGNADDQKRLDLFRKGWAQAGLEYAWFKFIESIKRTGDGAIIGYFSNGRFGVKPLSFFDGSELFPQYDPFTGELTLFARRYSAYDAEGGKTTEYVEVWDKRFFTRYRMGVGEGRSAKERLLGVFGLEGYEMVSAPQPHGFPFIPVVYYRDEMGPCWTPAQVNCDGYDLAFSQLSHNNKAYGFPIMVFKGESASVDHDIDGSVKMVNMGPDDDVRFLQATNASESFMKELDTLYKMIYEACFTVVPPSLKSGDLPAAALKILYSPAYEKAMSDAQEYLPSLKSLVDVVKWGVGIENEDTIGMQTLPVSAWIKPYVHVNETAVMSDLAMGVQNGFVSKQTASERASFYTSLNEWDRLVGEKKEAEAADLLYQYEQSKLAASGQE